jgi:hypothetical protein
MAQHNSSSGGIQEAERENDFAHWFSIFLLLFYFYFSLFIHGTPVNGMMPPTFRASLFPLVNPFWKLIETPRNVLY